MFSVRVSLRTRRTSSVDPDRLTSGRPRAVPGKVHPRAVETQVGPTATCRTRANSGKQTDHIRSKLVDPERPSSGRTRSDPSKVQPYPVETQVDPGRIRVGEPDWPASSRTDWPSSGRSRSNPNGPHPALIQSTQTGSHPDKPTWPYPGKFKQTPAYSSKLRTNTSEPSR